MPRPGPARPNVTFRPSPAGLAWLDSEAARVGASRTDVILAALVTFRELPEGARARAVERRATTVKA